MKYIKYAVMILILLSICVIVPAASWDIGAVQLEGGATDIGAVQESAAIGAPSGQVIMIQMTAVPIILILAVICLVRSRKYG